MSPVQPSEPSTGEDSMNDVFGVNSKLERALKSQDMLYGLRVRYCEFSRSSKQSTVPTVITHKIM